MNIVLPTTGYSPRKSANRAAKREAQANTRAAKIMVAAICSTADVAETVDSAGRVVRLTDATTIEIRAFLLNNRVVDTMDILAEVGEKAFNNLVANGSLIRDASFNRFKKNNRYWVTTKARDIYGLPAKITVGNGAAVDYAEAI